MGANRAGNVRIFEHFNVILKIFKAFQGFQGPTETLQRHTLAIKCVQDLHFQAHLAFRLTLLVDSTNQDIERGFLVF